MYADFGDNIFKEIEQKLIRPIAQPIKRISQSVVSESSRVIHKVGAEAGRTAVVKAVAKTAVGKEVARVGNRAAGIVSGVANATAKGDLVKAIGLMNPLAIGAKITSMSPRIIDTMNALTPASALQISDPAFKQKVLGAYAVAAVVAAAVFTGGMSMAVAGPLVGGTAGGVLGGQVVGGTAGEITKDVGGKRSEGVKVGEVVGTVAGAVAGGAVGSQWAASNTIIPGTGMTPSQMSAAGATNAQIADAQAAANTVIPGTGMTASQMAEAGATDDQIAEIEAAANAGDTNHAIDLMKAVNNASKAAGIISSAVKASQSLKPKAGTVTPTSDQYATADIFGSPLTWIIMSGVGVLYILITKPKR